MPRPNKRFLRHIIKDTDTHNKNLLAKEAAESRARLEILEQKGEAKRLKTNPNANDIRRRQMGDIHAILGSKKLPQTEHRSSNRNRSSDKDSSTRANSRANRSGVGQLFATGGSEGDKGRLKSPEHEGRGMRKRDSSSSSSRQQSRRDRTRSKSGETIGCSDTGMRRRSIEISKERSRSPGVRRRKHRQRSPLRSSQNDEDSDDLIGPKPAPTPRGRGALGGSSGIDRRFSETYDPAEDKQIEGSEGA